MYVYTYVYTYVCIVDRNVCRCRCWCWRSVWDIHSSPTPTSTNSYIHSYRQHIYILCWRCVCAYPSIYLPFSSKEHHILSKRAIHPLQKSHTLPHVSIHPSIYLPPHVSIHPSTAQKSSKEPYVPFKRALYPLQKSPVSSLKELHSLQKSTTFSLKEPYILSKRAIHFV